MRLFNKYAICEVILEGFDTYIVQNIGSKHPHNIKQAIDSYTTTIQNKYIIIHTHPSDEHKAVLPSHTIRTAIHGNRIQEVSVKSGMLGSSKDETQNPSNCIHVLNTNIIYCNIHYYAMSEYCIYLQIGRAHV